MNRILEPKLDSCRRRNTFFTTSNRPTALRAGTESQGRRNDSTDYDSARMRQALIFRRGSGTRMSVLTCTSE